jgi:hypothetical protein
VRNRASDGNPADEGRAGTYSPTHPHNVQSLDGWRERSTKDVKNTEMKNKKKQTKIKVNPERDRKSKVNARTRTPANRRGYV